MQTFMFEMANNMRENLGDNVGTYKTFNTKKSKTAFAIRSMTAMMLASSVAQLVAGKDNLYGPGSFVPFFSYLTGTGHGKGQLYSADMYSDGVRMIKALSEGDNVKAAKLINQHLSTAGIQLNRAIDTVEGVSNDEIQGWDIIKALIWGPNSLEANEDKSNTGAQSKVELPRKSSTRKPAAAPRKQSGGRR